MTSVLRLKYVRWVKDLKVIVTFISSKSRSEYQMSLFLLSLSLSEPYSDSDGRRSIVEYNLDSRIIVLTCITCNRNQ